MRWYNWLESIAVVSLIIWFINESLTDYTSGILHYNGFLPQCSTIVIPLFFTFCSLIYLGASIEDTIREVST